MKKRRKQPKLLCIALATALAWGDYGAVTAYASQSEVPGIFSAEPTDSVPAETPEMPLLPSTELPGSVPVAVPPVPSAELPGNVPAAVPPVPSTELPGSVPVVVPPVPSAELPGSVPALTAGETATDESAVPAFRELTEEELAAYYGDSVFIGDSIMLGFRNYSAKKTTFVHDIEFLAATSYSVRNALRPVKGNNIHPKYKGKKYQLWDSIPLTGRKRAFIMLGMNDLSVYGIKADTDKYKELIDKILETSPDLEIHIISVTYTLAGKGTPTLNSTSIDMYNSSLQEMAEENGWSYLDFCTLLSDGEGNLAEEYCSDHFVHLTKAAYTLWESELINYASRKVAEAEAENTAPAVEAAVVPDVMPAVAPAVAPATIQPTAQ